ncbi:hypothetical protein V2J09_007980 [Rumex salicifolius]
MRPPSLSLSSAAAAALFDSSLAMYSRPRFRPHYRGGGGGEGRGQWQRGYSDSPVHPSRSSENQVVTGYTHFQPVRATNLGFQPPDYNYINNQSFYPYNGNNYANNARFRAQFYSQRPNPEYNRNPSAEFGFRPHNASNQRPQQPFQQPPFRNGGLHHEHQPRRPRTNDYRRWDATKNPPPPTLERFSVLSYNILADYLAYKHRNMLYYHIPRRFIDWEWRRKSILFELGLWSPDIMCFQEVDRFSDLDEDLRDRGYTGIWKMRTGVPVDGCAMFWRTSRFKLVHEEHIEFSKLSMRDNVAQICVLESMIQNDNGDLSASSKSPAGPNKVVICNIHVLYNPKRGEIKLGQVRILLDRAQAVSKTWNDAPIVLCGDFNCTPKSALYNFISNQKLDLSEVDRDKVSGQASAEISPQTREFGSHSGVYSVPTPALENMGNNSEENVTAYQATGESDKTTESATAKEGISSSFTDKNQEDKAIALEGSTTDVSVGVEFDVSDVFNGLSLNAEDIGEDSEKFLSDLHFGEEIPEDLTQRMESVKINNNTYGYNPSLWTPMEIATATGDADCTVVEHPLKLTSTYTEVEGSSETRESSGEPVLTSYNACFMGTVDYIWRSEGIHTTRVLAPLSKNAVQWTQGFPTKKWGSDHIALVSELAFTKGSE